MIRVMETSVVLVQKDSNDTLVNVYSQYFCEYWYVVRAICYYRYVVIAGFFTV